MLTTGLAAGLAAVLVAGCTTTAERAIEDAAPGTDVEIEEGGGRIVIEDEEGSATVDLGGELPGRIDAAFAVPADYAVDATSEVTQDERTLVSATGHLEREDLASLTEEFADAVTAAGWTIDMTTGMGDEVQLIAASRGDDQLQVSMTATEGEPRRFDVVITLSLSGS